MTLPNKLGKLLSRLATWDNSLSARLTLTKEVGLRRTVAVLGAHLGDGLLWFVMAVIAFWLGSETTRHFVLLAAVTTVVAGTMTTGLKFLVRRGRPQEMSGFYSTRYDPHSFPSGHATRVACLAMVFSHQFPHWAAIFYALALFVVLCRVGLGIHYASDVLVGLAIGFLSSWVIVSTTW